MGDSIWEKHVDNYFWSYATQLLASVILIGTIIQLSRESLDFLSDILKCITGFYFCCGRLFLFFTETKQMNCWHWFQHIFPVWLFSSVQSLSHVWLFVTPWTVACQASLSTTNFWSLLKLMSMESVIPSNRLILCCCLLLLPSIVPSIRVFSIESVLPIRWPKYWSIGFSISPSNEYPGLISFRIDWFDLCAVQGTLKSLLQHHNSKTSILRCSAFFIVQLSHLYMTSGKSHSFD